LIVEEGYELRMNLLIEIEELKILSREKFSYILNNEKNGPIILANAMKRYSRVDLIVNPSYPYFNKKNSIEERRSRYKMGSLLDCELRV
jgi:hypothetical protein